MNNISIDYKRKGPLIGKKLHSQFIEFLGSCISDGIWVGTDSAVPNYQGLRKDVVDALAKLSPPVIRWPGGCYADNYHWRDGIGDYSSRPTNFNSNFGTFQPENNHFGTHEFMLLCSMVNAEPWLNINLMSGTILEMQEWAEYCNRADGTTLSELRKSNGSAEPFNVKYWGIGNESWGGGGTYTAGGYAADYRKFASAFPRFSSGMTSEMVLIAVGPDGNKPKERVRWTEDFFAELANYRQPALNGYDLHFYNWNVSHPQDDVIEFSESDWYRVIKGAEEIEDVITEQYELVQKGISKFPEAEGFWANEKPECRLIIGEWGNWHRFGLPVPSALWQQCTMRDAITTALTLDIFHRHCDKVSIACVAQTVNVLNSLILTFNDITVLTPNYHVFDMYKVHRDATLLPCIIEPEETGQSGGERRIYALASEKDGYINVNIINSSYSESARITLNIPVNAEYHSGLCLGDADPRSYNSPENPNAVVPKTANAPDRNGECWRVELPRASVSVYRFKVH